MKSGDLRERISILKRTEGTPDARGHRAVSWSVYKSCFAAVRDVTGREFYQAAAYQMEDTVTFTVRYDNMVTPEMRVTYAGDTYRIIEVNHLGYRRDFMSMRCKHVDAKSTN